MEAKMNMSVVNTFKLFMTEIKKKKLILFSSMLERTRIDILKMSSVTLFKT